MRGSVTVSRLGVDIDGRDWLRAMICLLEARRIVGSARCYLTAHGFHVEAWGREMPAPVSLEIRRLLGDDPQRVHMDELRLERGDLRQFDRLFEGGFKDGCEYFERRELRGWV